MKKITKYLILTLISLFALSNLKAEEVKFVTGSYAEVLKLAKSENKIIMADVYTEWCIWCKQLEMTVYTDPAVSEFANKNQINWKFDAENGEGIELAKKFDIKGYPTLIFIDGDGNEVDRMYGTFTAQEFLEFIKGINSGTGTINSMKASLVKNPDDVKMNYELSRRYGNLEMSKEAEPLYKKIIALDPDNKYGYTDIAEFQLAMFNKDDTKVQSLLNKYPSSGGVKDAKIFLLEKNMEAKDIAKCQDCLNDLLKNFGTDELAKYQIGSYYLYQASNMLRDTAKLNDDVRQEALNAVDKSLEYFTGVFVCSGQRMKSEIYYQMKNKEQALASINKALSIWDRDAYRKQKAKIEKL
jgi:thioredoxin-related protein